MAISNDNGNNMGPADFAAMLGNFGGNTGGFGGGAIWWMMILFLFAFLFMGNWGGNNNGGNSGGGVTPYVIGSTVGGDVQRGFDQQALMGAIGNVGTVAANGFANADVARCNQTINILQALANNQTASMQTLNSLAMSLQQCCCDNKAGIADIKYTVATEACNDRQAVNDMGQNLLMQGVNNTNALTGEMRSGFQALQDKLCQLELDGIKRDYDNQLRTQQNMYNNVVAENQALRLSAQLGAVQSNLVANNEAQTTALEQYLNPVPVPAYVVQNPNCCSTNTCGCGSF